MENNLTIFDSYAKCLSVFKKFDNIEVGISGGSDSDIILDICERAAKELSIKVNYVFFDTGLEYKATKEHLDFLEEKYKIEIERYKAIKPIPVSLRQHGQPFLSKYVSAMITRLQKHDFDFSIADTMTFEEAYKIYPKCKSGLMWFYNMNENSYTKDGKLRCISSFNIDRNKGLRQFLIDNPPQFKISDACCLYAKKKVSKKISKRK